MLAGGTALIVVGLAIGWLPGPGGFLAFVGLAMIAIEIPCAARALDVGEVKLRAVYNILRNMVRHLFMRSSKRT